MEQDEKPPVQILEDEELDAVAGGTTAVGAITGMHGGSQGSGSDGNSGGSSGWSKTDTIATSITVSTGAAAATTVAIFKRLRK